MVVGIKCMYFSEVIEQINLMPSECLIIVHPTMGKLEQFIEEIKTTTDFPIIDIGKELSSVLLTIQPDEYARRILNWLRVRTEDLYPGPAICVNIALLFEPSFLLDPLALFHQIGRRTKLIILWPGDLNSDVLTYAVPEHHHFRTWRIFDPNTRVYRLEN